MSLRPSQSRDESLHPGSHHQNNKPPEGRLTVREVREMIASRPPPPAGGAPMSVPEMVAALERKGYIVVVPPGGSRR